MKPYPSTDSILSLCAPSAERSCFGCCPPIRPAHYDPLDYAGSLRREFSDNRRQWLKEGPRFRPIVGYSCWALGFLDDRGRRVGCLLHPYQNDGKDLRFLVDYGDKCRRESCPSAQSFALLPTCGQHFWLDLTTGLNSFSYSSRKTNPLFALALWGREVLEPLRLWSEAQGLTAAELLHVQPFLTRSSWQPKAHRFLFRAILEVRPEVKNLESTASMLESRLKALAESLDRLRSSSQAVYTHHLAMEADFLDFMRLGLGWEIIDPQTALTFRSEAALLLQSL